MWDRIFFYKIIYFTYLHSISFRFNIIEYRVKRIMSEICESQTKNLKWNSLIKEELSKGKIF